MVHCLLPSLGGVVQAEVQAVRAKQEANVVYNPSPAMQPRPSPKLPPAYFGSNTGTSLSRHSSEDYITSGASQGPGAKANAKKYFEEGVYSVLHEWWAENIENP